MLERLIAHNDQIPLSPYVSVTFSAAIRYVLIFILIASESLTRFHSRSPPSISVLEYLRRIVKYANVEVRRFLDLRIIV